MKAISNDDVPSIASSSQTATPNISRTATPVPGNTCSDAARLPSKLISDENSAVVDETCVKTEPCDVIDSKLSTPYKSETCAKEEDSLKEADVKKEASDDVKDTASLKIKISKKLIGLSSSTGSDCKEGIQDEIKTNVHKDENLLKEDTIEEKPVSEKICVKKENEAAKTIVENNVTGKEKDSEQTAFTKPLGKESETENEEENCVKDVVVEKETEKATQPSIVVTTQVKHTDAVEASTEVGNTTKSHDVTEPSLSPLKSAPQTTPSPRKGRHNRVISTPVTSSPQRVVRKILIRSRETMRKRKRSDDVGATDSEGEESSRPIATSAAAVTTEAPAEAPVVNNTQPPGE